LSGWRVARNEALVRSLSWVPTTGPDPTADFWGNQGFGVSEGGDRSLDRCSASEVRAVPLYESCVGFTSPFDRAVSPDRRVLGVVDWAKPDNLWHSFAVPNPTLIYRRTKNLQAVQLLLGHSKLESTVRYLGIEVDDALEITEQTEV